MDQLSWIEALRYVGTPLGLVAFVVGIVAAVVRHRLAERRRLIASADIEARVPLIEGVFRDFRVIETDNLTRSQRFELARQALDQRLRQYRTAAITGIGLAVIVAVVAIGSATTADSYELVVRPRRPAGAEDGSLNEPLRGTIRLEAGDITASRPLVENEARFTGLPASVAGQAATLTPHVEGFAELPHEVDRLPRGGSLELALVPVSINVCGRAVLTGDSGLGIQGVTVEIDRTVTVTGPAGKFCLTLSTPAGTVRRVTAIVDDRVVYESFESLAPQNELLLVVPLSEEG